MHASLPADNPAHVASVLAEIINGEVLAFPPGGSDAYVAWANDGSVALEITKRGSALTFGPVEAEWRPDASTERRTESHLAISVALSKAQIIKIAKTANWPVRHCVRANGLFDLVEVWVEGAFLLEFFDPSQTETYKTRVTPKAWKQILTARAS